MVLAAAIGPFSQQAVKTVGCVRVVEDEIATVPVSNYLNPASNAYYRTQTGAGPFDLDYSLKGILVNALSDVSDDALTATVSTNLEPMDFRPLGS